MEQGLVVLLEFTAFDIESHGTCKYDHLTITDGDGTTMMEKSCGTTLPANMTSTSNVVNMFFKSDDQVTKKGWSVSWSALLPGVLFPKNETSFTKSGMVVSDKRKYSFAFFHSETISE